MKKALLMQHPVSQAALLVLLMAFTLTGCNGPPPPLDPAPDPLKYTIELINFPPEEKSYLVKSLNELCDKSMSRSEGKQEAHKSIYAFTPCDNLQDEVEFELALGRLVSGLEVSVAFEDRPTFTIENWYEESNSWGDCTQEMCSVDAKAESDSKELAIEGAKQEVTDRLWSFVAGDQQLITRYISRLGTSNGSFHKFELTVMRSLESAVGDLEKNAHTGFVLCGSTGGIEAWKTKWQEEVIKNGTDEMYKQSGSKTGSRKRFIIGPLQDGKFRGYVRLSLPYDVLLDIWKDAVSAPEIPCN